MIVSKGPKSEKISDLWYTRYVDFIQSTFVRADVWVDAKRKKHLNRQPSQSLLEKLKELGLIPDRLWWGPLTLKQHKFAFLIEQIEQNPPDYVLEVGCGASTAVFAALAERYDFKLLSLENHAGSIDYVRYLIDGLPCAKRIQIQQCDFTRKQAPNGKPYWWFNFNLEAFRKSFDFVLIDAPMAKLVGRRGALLELLPYLADEHRIFLDDSERKHEQSCIREWRDYYPNLVVEASGDYPDIAYLAVPSAV